MSSIPIRKGSGSRKSAVLKDITGAQLAEPSTGQQGKPRCRMHTTKDSKELAKPTTYASTKKELVSENAVLRDKLDGQNHRLAEMGTNLTAAQERLVELSAECEETENKYKETIATTKKQCTLLEAHLEAAEQKLLKANLDPVTLESLGTSPREEEQLERRCMETKNDVASLREDLYQFNSDASACLQNLQNLDCKSSAILSQLLPAVTRSDTGTTAARFDGTVLSQLLPADTHSDTGTTAARFDGTDT